MRISAVSIVSGCLSWIFLFLSYMKFEFKKSILLKVMRYSFVYSRGISLPSTSHSAVWHRWDLAM